MKYKLLITFLLILSISFKVVASENKSEKTSRAFGIWSSFGIGGGTNGVEGLLEVSGYYAHFSYTARVISAIGILSFSQSSPTGNTFNREFSALFGGNFHYKKFYMAILTGAGLSMYTDFHDAMKERGNTIAWSSEIQFKEKQ